MKLINKTNRKSWFGSTGILNSKRLVSLPIIAGSLAVLSIALVTSQMIPVGNRNAGSAPPFESQAAATLLPESGDHIAISTNTQSENETYSQVNAKEVIHDFLFNGLEFAVTGVEVASPVGPLKQFGTTISQLAKSISSPEDPLTAESVPTVNTILVSDRQPSSSEREVAVWLLQNATWTH